MSKHTVTLIPGDGIGPEITEATCKIIEAAGVNVHWEICEAGAQVFKKGLASGIPQETLDSIQKHKVALKGPLETPVGYGEKSANVTLRKFFETYGNIRPVKEMPGIITPYQGRNVDIVIVRENIEDLYAGIEYGLTPGVAVALKLISRKGCEKIVRLAFEYALSAGRKKVHCATKANILKMTEGKLKQVFEEIATDYPMLEAHHIIVDNCAHQLVKEPEKFDVIVTTNMNGDILSDLCSGLVGGLGFAPGANIGDKVAIFEAVHGSAPKYAGKNVINPTAMLLSGVMMLRHIGEFQAADAIENALYVTFEQGIFTQDIKSPQEAVSTTSFTQAIVENLGKTSLKWKKVSYKPFCQSITSPSSHNETPQDKKLVGIDLYIQSTEEAETLGKKMEELCAFSSFSLKFISNRGVVAYPTLKGATTDMIDLWRCRFLARQQDNPLGEQDILQLLTGLSHACEWISLKKLFTLNGSPCFSKAQGEI